jgi:hypothetical protein
MSNQEITYLVVGGAGLIGLVAWIALIVVPACKAYWGWWERFLAVLLSVYVGAAFVLAGAGVGAAVLWYYDRL